MVCLDGQDGQGPIVSLGFHWIRTNIKIHILIKSTGFIGKAILDIGRCRS